jgi:general secretion pathway protein J
MNKRRNPRQSGFTLVELLVAITILAMVLASVAGTVRVSSRLAGSVTERAHSVDRQVQIRSFLRRHLSRASVAKVREADGRENVVFSGSLRRITFVAPLSESAAVGGLHWLTLQVEDYEEGQRLVLLHEPFLPQSRGGDWQQDSGREVLLERMQRIEFGYLGDDSTASYWSDEWNDPDVIPALIRIQLDSQDRQVWPQVVVAPRIDSPQPLGKI